MKHRAALRLSAWHLFFSIALIAFFPACQNKEEVKKSPPITAENLQTALTRERRLEHSYALFADKAEKEKYSNIARLYRAVSRSEAIHAASHEAMLRSLGVEPQQSPMDSVIVGTVMQTLRMSESEEKIECESMYPNLIRTAVAENLGDVAESFKRAEDADARHAELFREAIDRGGVVLKTWYYICPGCGLIMTSDETTECPSCHIGKDKFIRI